MCFSVTTVVNNNIIIPILNEFEYNHEKKNISLDHLKIDVEEKSCAGTVPIMES